MARENLDSTVEAANNLPVTAVFLQTTQRRNRNNPLAVMDIGEPMRQTEIQNHTEHSLQAQVSSLPEPIDRVCSEVHQAALDLGHEPIRPCGDQGAYLDPDATPYIPAPEPETEQTQNSSNSEPTADTVLLIHGFSITHGHNCSDYWLPQKEAIEAEGKTALIIGYYMLNSGDCDVDLPAESSIWHNTPIGSIAQDLRDWINDNLNGSYVDIVAHSMGGLVVRKMLQDWGHELLIPNVVTLATPHNGLKAAILAPVCFGSVQCYEMSHDSPFMLTLSHNPQSIIPTQWTLIGVKDDQTIGEDTSIDMSNGNAGGPVVSTYQYPSSAKFSCSNTLALGIGHGDVHGDNATETVFDCRDTSLSLKPMDNPQDRMMEALGLD